MKKMKWFSVLFTCFLLISCYEVNEEIVIDESGAGTYVSKMDMGQLMEMLQSFGGDEMKNEGLDKIVDTSIAMSSISDSIKDLSPEQKAVLNSGKMRLQMNMKESLFKIDADFKFKSFNDLQLLLSSGGGMSSMSSLMSKAMGKAEKKEDMPDSPKDPEMEKLNGVYDITVKNGSIIKTLNKERYNKVMSNPEMEQMKGAGAAGLEVLYTTVIKLPRPVTSPESSIVKLSADKKTVTIRYNFLDIFEKPENLNFTITY